MHEVAVRSVQRSILYPRIVEPLSATGATHLKIKEPAIELSTPGLPRTGALIGTVGTY